MNINTIYKAEENIFSMYLLKSGTVVLVKKRDFKLLCVGYTIFKGAISLYQGSVHQDLWSPSQHHLRDDPPY